MVFAVKARLGRGRTVETFQAILGAGEEAHQVVVKRPRPELASNEVFTAALIEWGEAQKAADHEHVVATFEAGRTADGAYVIQERVDGATLETVLRTLRRRKRTLTAAYALIIADRVAAGLAYLHTSHLGPHAALDPGDVLISYDGEVKVADQRLHGLDAHVGSDLLDDPDPYRAPERPRGGAGTHAADLYAFGLITLEMLIGHPVWTAASMSVGDALGALRDFTQLGQVQPALTSDLLDVLRTCLAERPEDRAESAAPVAKALSAALARHGITPDAPGLGKFVRAVVPPPEAEEAPTMMVSADQAEELARKQDARIQEYEGASEPISPEIERAAELRAPIELVGARVELARVPERFAPKALARSVSAEPQARADSAPVAPSVQRASARVVPDVARVAARASSARFGRDRFLVVAAVVGALLLALAGLWMFTGSAAPRQVRLRATSEPSGAQIWIGDREVGRTPFEGEVEVRKEMLQLRFTLDGYAPHQVSVAAERAELRYHAPLEKSGKDD